MNKSLSCVLISLMSFTPASSKLIEAKAKRAALIQDYLLKLTELVNQAAADRAPWSFAVAEITGRNESLPDDVLEAASRLLSANGYSCARSTGGRYERGYDDESYTVTDHTLKVDYMRCD
jgi:hypothetical protein